MIGGVLGCVSAPLRRVPTPSMPIHRCPPTPQGILREGLEDVKQFFKAHGSCRLPLSPSLLVKGIVPRVSAGAGGLDGLLSPPSSP